jgi:hypothetical protein
LSQTKDHPRPTIKPNQKSTFPPVGQYIIGYSDIDHPPPKNLPHGLLFAKNLNQDTFEISENTV